MSNWQLEIEDDVAVLTIDVEGESVNILPHGVLREMDQRLAEIEKQSLVGLIIRSGKKNGFIAGADIKELQKVTDPARAAELSRAGQHIFNRLAQLSYPTIAVINGFCLGGGLELALACRYRIALDHPGTRLGLPEVRLGLHPGYSGTSRLPKLIGDLAALDLMLTGRAVGTREARRIGLIDDVVPERHLMTAALSFVRRQPKPQRPGIRQRLPGIAPLRPLVQRLLVRRVRRKAHPAHYPAPYRILDLWRDGAGQEQEAVSFGELMVGRTSRNLVHVFLLGEDMKRHGRASKHNIRHVHVIGAGVMGADIAIWAAYKGFTVSLQDLNTETLAKAVKKAHGFFKGKLKDPRALQATMDRFMPDARGSGLTRADLVIEAIVEQVEPKQVVLREAEARAPAHALLGTNTSSIPLETIAEGLRDPARLVGLHFFNPVAKMQLVEVVRGQSSSDDAMSRARAFTVAIDRLPLDVKSSPGFLVNRILMPYLIEAVKLVEEGVPLAHIDREACEFGMPMGPIELADTVGLDICLSVAEMLSKPLAIEVPALLRQMVSEKRLGRKSGEGFYKYTDTGARRGVRGGKATELPIKERLILRLLNEAVACLREGVVVDGNAVDGGMVYGTGFAPYLGGPMRYIESMGETGISHSLYRLSQEYGKRFTPDAGWSQPDLFLRHATV